MVSGCFISVSCLSQHGKRNAPTCSHLYRIPNCAASRFFIRANSTRARLLLTGFSGATGSGKSSCAGVIVISRRLSKREFGC